MSNATLVKLLKDVYPFGCKGDLRHYADEELAQLKVKVNKLGLDHAFETPAEPAPAAPAASSDSKSEDDSKPASKGADKPSK